MNERTDGVQRGWYSLGQYRILAIALSLNPYFTTHIIYLRDKLIGRQLSVPSLSDCRWFDARGGQYAEEAETRKAIFGYTAQTLARRGRPTNAERARRQALSEAEIA